VIVANAVGGRDGNQGVSEEPLGFMRGNEFQGFNRRSPRFIWVSFGDGSLDANVNAVFTRRGVHHLKNGGGVAYRLLRHGLKIHGQKRLGKDNNLNPAEEI
jgi:hypothetical protein